MVPIAALMIARVAVVRALEKWNWMLGLGQQKKLGLPTLQMLRRKFSMN
jgi:signal transduction histidine kinase